MTCLFLAPSIRKSERHDGFSLAHGRGVQERRHPNSKTKTRMGDRMAVSKELKMTSPPAPFRADHVGSFLCARYLRDAREFNDERSGDFEPLRLLPKGPKRLALGLVTTKRGKARRSRVGCRPRCLCPNTTWPTPARPMPFGLAPSKAWC
jgi:hypothetical protein